MNKKIYEKKTLWEWCFLLQATICLIGITAEKCHDYIKERKETLEEDSLHCVEHIQNNYATTYDTINMI